MGKGGHAAFGSARFSLEFLSQSRRKWQKITRAEHAAVEAARAAADHRIAACARKVVKIWNARSELFFYPTNRAAITAECPWLDYTATDMFANRED